MYPFTVYIPLRKLKAAIKGWLACSREGERERDIEKNEHVGVAQYCKEPLGSICTSRCKLHRTLPLSATWRTVRWRKRYGPVHAEDALILM